MGQCCSPFSSQTPLLSQFPKHIIAKPLLCFHHPATSHAWLALCRPPPMADLRRPAAPFPPHFLLPSIFFSRNQIRNKFSHPSHILSPPPQQDVPCAPYGPACHAVGWPPCSRAVRGPLSCLPLFSFLISSKVPFTHPLQSPSPSSLSPSRFALKQFFWCFSVANIQWVLSYKLDLWISSFFVVFSSRRWWVQTRQSVDRYA